MALREGGYEWYWYSTNGKWSKEMVLENIIYDVEERRSEH